MFDRCMSRAWMIFALAAASALLGAVPAQAGSECDSLVLRDRNGTPKDPDRLKDKSLFVNRSGKWLYVSDVRSLVEKGEKSNFSFMYLAKGDGGDHGVIVVKAGDVVIPGDSDERRVQLTRKRTQALRLQNCSYPAKAPFFGSVAGSSYDRYHDHGIEKTGSLFASWFGSGPSKEEREFAGDVRKMKEFHVPYQRSRRNSDYGQCAFSDDVGNGNRARFSFDDSVSGTGRIYSKVNVFKTAYAGEKIQMRQVHMAPYELDEGGLACITFRMKISDRTLLSILDLEK